MNSAAFEKLGIKAFDAAEYLQSDEDCAAYLQACLEQEPNNAALFAKTLGDIARARGMMQLAKDTGLTQETSQTSSTKKPPTQLEKLKDALREENAQAPKRTLSELASYRDAPASR